MTVILWPISSSVMVWLTAVFAPAAAVEVAEVVDGDFVSALGTRVVADTSGESSLPQAARAAATVTAARPRRALG